MVAVLGMLVFATAASSVGAPMSAASAGTDGGAPCAGVRKVSGGDGDVPVVLVHGFAGGPGKFRARRADRPSMAEAIGRVRGVATYTFDYTARSLEWVTDPAIGPALASAITCLADRHGRRVVVVAHSMGGLAVRFAQAQTVPDPAAPAAPGRPVAAAIDALVTIGTPFDGAQLLGFANGTGGEVFNEVADAALGTCDRRQRQRRARDFCGLLGTTETPAVRAMIPGSDELAALPRWTPHLRRFAIAADIDVTVGAFGLGQTIGLGDLAVSVDSALAGASRRVAPFVAGCRSGLFELPLALDDSPCSHTNLLTNRRIQRRVRDFVRAELRRPTAP